MKKVRVIDDNINQFEDFSLEDFSTFKDDINTIKYMKKIKQDVDRLQISDIIEKLGIKGKKITAKRVQKIFKELIAKKIKEVK